MGDVIEVYDCEEVVRSWANTAGAWPNLVGNGRPLASGVHQSVRSGSPGQSVFAVAARLPSGGDDGGMPVDKPRMSLSVYGPNKAAAFTGAAALANALRNIAGHSASTVVGGITYRLLYAERVTLGWVPDGTRARYIVDATLAIAPA